MPQDDPNLSTGRTDIVASAMKAVVGGIPVIGSVLAETFSYVVPNQRTDRIADFLLQLAQRVHGLEEEFVKKAKDPEYVDLLEDGMYQAARALSSDRRKHIAAVLANSLTDKDLAHIQKKRLLQLLGELNDAEIILLRGYADEIGEDSEFFKKNEAVFEAAPRAYIGAPQELIDQAAVHATYDETLKRLGLIAPQYRRPSKRDGMPVFDYKTGTVESSYVHITSLGRLLLRYIGETPPDNQEVSG